MKHPTIHSPKTRTDIRSAFTDADSRLVIDQKRRQNTLDLLHDTIEYKEVRLVYRKRQIWLNQFRYADKNMLLFHLSGSIIILFLMVLMDIRNVDSRFMTAFAMIFAGVLGSFSILALSRICFTRPAELSESCYFNVRQLTAFDMVFSGLVNLAVLSMVIIFAGLQWKIRLIQVVLYLLVPFIVTQCVCLGVLLTEAGRRNAWLVAATGAFLSVFYMILASTPHLYTESALFIWVIALFLSAVIFTIQIHTLFREISKGDILCTN